MDKSKAPWTGEQVALLSARQHALELHPYTCAIHGSAPLIPAKDGWHCPVWNCEYQQDWAIEQDVNEPYWWHRS